MTENITKTDVPLKEHENLNLFRKQKQINQLIKNPHNSHRK